MYLYGREPLKPGTEISTQLVDCFDASKVVGIRTLRFDEFVSSGGSCLVYRGKLIETSGGTDTMIPVLIKECYPPYNKCMLRRDGVNLEPEKESEQGFFDALKENFIAEQQIVSRFYQETSQKDIFLAQELNNTIYIISLYGKGRTLDKFGRSELNPEKISRIMYSLCENLYKLHTLKSGAYLYLDCKPENIFCEDDGGVFINEKRTKVSLFDFDTAVPLEVIKMNAYRTVSGSEGWAAPEQIIVEGKNGKQYNNPKKINKKTDIFSAGAVFYQLLTGEKIKFSITDRSDLDQISTGIFPWAEENIKDEKERELVKKILGSSLAYENDDRKYESFHQMMEDFEELIVLTEGTLPDRQSIYAELREIKQILDNKVETPHNLKRTEKMHSVPRRNVNFTGRKKELDLIESGFHSGKNIQVIYGQGGMGKTQIALEYICAHTEEYELVHWIDAISIDSIERNIKAFLRTVGIECRFSDDNGFLNYYRDFLDSVTNSCVVFDNIDLYDEKVILFLNKLFFGVNKSIQFLLTTRSRKNMNGVVFIEVDIFTKEDSIEFLLRNSADEDLDDATTLAERLHYHPLAIEMARSYINATPGCSFKSYLGYLNKGVPVLKENVEVFDYKESLKDIVEISLERMHSDNDDYLTECAITFLRICAYCSPHIISIKPFLVFAQHYATEEAPAADDIWRCFYNLEQCFCDDLKRDQLLRMLEKYALLRKGNGRYLSIHELTQEIIRDYIWPSDIDHSLTVTMAEEIFVYSLSQKLIGTSNEDMADLYQHLAYIGEIDLKRARLKGTLSKSLSITDLEISKIVRSILANKSQISRLVEANGEKTDLSSKLAEILGEVNNINKMLNKDCFTKREQYELGAVGAGFALEAFIDNKKYLQACFTATIALRLIRRGKDEFEDAYMDENVNQIITILDDVLFLLQLTCVSTMEHNMYEADLSFLQTIAHDYYKKGVISNQNISLCDQIIKAYNTKNRLDLPSNSARYIFTVSS